MNRRDFLKITGITAAGVAVSSVSFLALGNEAQHIVVERVQLPVVDLPPSLEGFRIAQLSDFHLEPLTKIELVQRAVAITNSLKPDVIVLTGDYVWHQVESIFDLAPELAKLNAKHGIVPVIGNHDIWGGLDIIKAGFKNAGLPLYINQGVQLVEGKSSLHLACLDDGWSGTPDLEAAMENWVDGSPVVLLLHEPDLADRYSSDSRISLQLAGHTHGGQVRFPFLGAVILPYLGQKYDYRLYRVNSMWLYTNPGIGVISEPVRYNCPPEITEFTLARA